VLVCASAALVAYQQLTLCESHLLARYFGQMVVRVVLTDGTPECVFHDFDSALQSLGFQPRNNHIIIQMSFNDTNARMCT
jgi:hypothetical protein